VGDDSAKIPDRVASRAADRASKPMSVPVARGPRGVKGSAFASALQGALFGAIAGPFGYFFLGAGALALIAVLPQAGDWELNAAVYLIAGGAAAGAFFVRPGRRCQVCGSEVDIKPPPRCTDVPPWLRPPA
jgi:hypothetical protein